MMTMDQTRENAKRTKKRSRSGADTPCPICDKKLRGDKGLISHMMNEHNAAYSAARHNSHMGSEGADGLVQQIKGLRK